MFKIKLLILLLSSTIFITCTKISSSNNIKLNVGYIEGEYDGLFLSNRIKLHLNNLNMLDLKSDLEIRANISHTSNLFVTNIDNTSDRERITSKIDINIYDKKKKCIVHKYNKMMSQFYVLAKSDKFTSNVTAVNNIKSENVDNLVKKFVTKLSKKELICKKNSLKNKMKSLKRFVNESKKY